MGHLAECVQRLLHQRCATLRTGHVTGHGKRIAAVRLDLIGHCFYVAKRTRGTYHFSPSFSIGQSNGSAYAFTGSSNDGNTVGKTESVN